MSCHRLARVGSRLLSVLVLALGLVGAASTAPPLRIGVSLGISGSYADIARLQQRAYRLWEKHVNQAGGILGRPVQVIIRDDHSNPDVARSIYGDFIEREKFDFVIGPYSSPITAAVAPIADHHGYPMLAAGASADELWKHGYENLFGVYSPAGRYVIGFLAVLAQAGIDRIAVVAVDDVFSRGVMEGAKKWAPLHHIRITAVIVQPKASPDMEHAATLARQSGAQAIVLAGHFSEAVQMRRALKRIRWSPAAYYAAVGPAVRKYAEELGDDAHGTFSTSQWEPRDDPRLPGSSAFLRDFMETYGETPSYHAATAYAAGQILAQAILKAGTTDRAAVRRALFGLDTYSVVGRYAVDRTGSQAKHFTLIVQWQGNKREIVWPPELRTAPPIVQK